MNCSGFARATVFVAAFYMMPKMSAAAGFYLEGAVSYSPESITIVGSTRTLVENFSTVSLTQQDLRELMLLDGNDLIEHLAIASIGIGDTQYVVFIDGRIAGGKEVLAGIPIQAILSINLLEGADAVQMGAPPGVTAILVNLDNNLTVQKIQPKISIANNNYLKEFTYKVLKRRPTLSWSSELAASESDSVEKASWLGELELAASAIGDVTINLGLVRSTTTGTDSLSTADAEDIELYSLTQNASLSWRRYLMPVGWALIGNASQSNLSFGNYGLKISEFSHNLLASGPIMPLGSDAVFMTLSTRSSDQMRALEGSAEHKNTVQEFMGLSIPISRVWERNSGKRTSKTSVSLSQIWTRIGSARKVRISAEILYVQDKRFRTSIGWQLSEPAGDLNTLEKCENEYFPSANEVSESDPSTCIPERSPKKNSTVWGEWFFTPSPRGPWSVAVRLKRTAFSQSYSSIQPSSDNILLQDAFSVRFRVFGKLSENDGLAAGRPHNRWDASIGLTVEKSRSGEDAEHSLLKATGVLQARVVLRNVVVAVNGRIVLDDGVGVTRSSMASFGAYVDFPLIKDSVGNEHAAVWRDGPRIRAEITQRQFKESPTETTLSLRLSKSF